MPPYINYYYSRDDFLAHGLQPCNPGEICPICTDTTADVHLPCHQSHLCCRTCIAVWFEQSNTCPMCRTPLFEPDENNCADPQQMLEMDVHWGEDDPPFELDSADEWPDEEFELGLFAPAMNAFPEERQPGFGGTIEDEWNAGLNGLLADLSLEDFDEFEAAIIDYDGEQE